MITLFNALWERVRHLMGNGPAWLVLLSALALSAVGVLAIGTVEPDYATKQASLWLPASLAFMLLCLLPHPRTMGLISYALLGFSVFLLVYLFIPGAPRVVRVNGAISWLDFGVMRFQPSELAKVAFVLACGWYLCYRESHRELWGLVPPFALMAVPQVLILKQPALGMAMLFPAMLFAMLMAAGAKLRHLFTLTAVGVAFAAVVFINTLCMPKQYHILKDYQAVRIESLYKGWMGDTTMERDEGYQQGRGMALISAGGLQGYRKEAGKIIEANALPEDHTDMILCVIGARWGLLGLAGLMGLYMALVGGMLGVAAKSWDPFIRLCCVGFAALLLTQVVSNIGMCLGLMPITGLPLPFVSYGGSSMLCTFGMVGLVLNFASRPKDRLARQSFEFKGR